MTFSSAVRDPNDALRSFEINTNGLAVSVQGFLSLGSRGWRLTAAISKRRSTVTVRVRAIARDAQPEADLEHHEYQVRIALPRAGRYSIRVLHEIVTPDLSPDPMPHAVFERLTTLV